MDPVCLRSQKTFTVGQGCEGAFSRRARSRVMYAPQRIGLGWVVLLSAVACSDSRPSHDGNVGTAPSASHVASSATPGEKRAAATITALRSFPALEYRVGSGQVLERTARGFRPAAPERTLVGELPGTANEPLSFALYEDAAFSIEVTD